MPGLPRTAGVPTPRTLESASHQLGTISLADRSLIDVLLEVCQLALAVVPGVDAASITVIDDDDETCTTVFTSDLAGTLDERQCSSGFGTGLDAAESGLVVRIDDTTHDTAYPGCALLAHHQDVHGVPSLGLLVPGHVRASLTLYRLRQGAPFTTDTEAAAIAYGERAVVVLANAAFLAGTTRRVTPRVFSAGAALSRPVQPGWSICWDWATC